MDSKLTKQKQKKPETPTGFVIVDIDNPYFNSSHHGSESQHKRTQALYNPRESPIAWMYAHREQTGVTEAQVAAAHEFRKLYETARGVGIRSMDYEKTPVDGGKMGDILTDRQVDASNELAAAHCRIGSHGYQLVEQVCGQCIFIRQLAARRSAQNKLSQHLKESLETLAVFWGLQRLRTRTYRRAS